MGPVQGCTTDLKGDNFFFKGHLVASYSLLAQEQTDTFVKAEYVLLIISLSLTPDISAGHEVGQRLYLFPSSETITFLLHFLMLRHVHTTILMSFS